MTATLTAPPSALDRLRAAAKPKAAAKDDSPPVVNIPEALKIAARREWLKTEMKNMKVEFDGCSADLKALAEPERVALSRKLRKCLSSVKVAGLTYSAQNRYAAIKDMSDDGGPTLDAQIAALRADDPGDFEQHFVEILDISVDVKKLSDAQMSALLEMDPTITRSLKPTEAFHHARTLDPAVAEFADKHHLDFVQSFR